MFGEDFQFREGTILDAGSGQSSLFTSPQNPGMTSGFGEEEDLSAYLRRLLSDNEEKPSFGFLDALIRRGL